MGEMKSSFQISKEFEEMTKVLANFSTQENFARILLIGDLLAETFQSNNKILICGNGGSMADAMHFAEELSGKFRHERPALPALALSDPSFLSCVANDFGYDEVFARGVEAFGQPGDVLITLSTSGNSINILKAAEKARKLAMKVVALTGNDGGKLASLVDFELRVPHTGFADRIQEIHIKIIHTLIAYIEAKLFNI